MKNQGVTAIRRDPIFYRDLAPRLSFPRGNKQLADHPVESEGAEAISRISFSVS